MSCDICNPRRFRVWDTKENLWVTGGAIVCPMCGEPLTEPKALTLEELVNRLGKPVYIICGDIAGWGIVHHISEHDVEFGGWSFKIQFSHDQMGIDWLAYTHKPKEL